MTKESKICKEGGEDEGLFFPAGGKWELELDDWIKRCIYGFALFWFFLGANCVSDAFTAAIETITSKKKLVWCPVKQRHRTMKVWNETIANLTLMALGSSAPEIMLNVVEVFRQEFFAGPLGPGTIVGSAAFNLLIITAVCIMSIPNGEVRQIKDTGVYMVTATFSLFAYAWLIIVLMAPPSKDVVRWWEAAATLFFFPLLLVVSFAADKGWISGVAAVANRRKIKACEMTKEELAQMTEELREEFGDLDPHTLAVLIERRTAAVPTRAQIRARMRVPNVMGRTLSSESTPSKSTQIPTTSMVVQAPSRDSATRITRLRQTMIPEGQATIEWATAHYAVMESMKKVVAEATRMDNYKSRVSVRWRTKEGTANAGKDFIHEEGVLVFEPNDKVQSATVRILDDDDWEQAEDFYIELFDAKCESGTVAFGTAAVTTVTIIDDDDPGALAFSRDFIVHESDLAGEVTIEIIRKHGSKGDISCSYKSEDDSAVAPLDYEAVEDTLVLKEGEVSSKIVVQVPARGRYDATERFRIVLTDPVGCRFDTTADGDEEHINCTVELKASDEARGLVDKLAQTLTVNWDKARMGTDNWKEQFVSALYVGGCPEEQKEAGVIDWFFHLLSLPWKLIFAFIPPCDFGGGWWCFVVSLLFIGLITAAIGDIAGLFGCAFGLPNQVTAITFVAFGTSLPDTFASVSAAKADPYADASITNVTGSNSVNVFLGLGLPWFIASSYWWINGQSSEWRDKVPSHVLRDYPGEAVYVLEANELGFSVSIFTACALCAICCLAARRMLFDGELGGPRIPQVASAAYLVFLWFSYVAASWLYIKAKEP